MSSQSKRVLQVSPRAYTRSFALSPLVLSPFCLSECFSFAASHHTPSFFSDERVTKASRAETRVSTTQSATVTNQNNVISSFSLWIKDRRRRTVRERKKQRTHSKSEAGQVDQKIQTANEADKHQASLPIRQRLRQYRRMAWETLEDASRETGL